MKKLKNMKSIITYGVIILLSISAFTGYIIKSRSDRDATPAEKAVVEKSTTGTSATVQTAAEPAKTEETIAHTAMLLTDGNNITGKSDEERQEHVKEIMAKSSRKLDPNPLIGIGRGEEYEKVTLEAIANAGGLKDVIKKGDVVLIKPNICTTYINAGAPQITDYRTVQAVADMVLQLGASKVVVAEGSFYGNVFEYEKNRFVSLKGVELFNFNSCEEKDCYELKPKKSLVGKALFVPKIYMDADVVITVAKLKTHFLTWASFSLKNDIGVPSEKIYGGSGDKSGLHNLDIDSVIVDLNKIRMPDFAVIEGIVGGEGYGPVENTPVKSNIILAGKDLVALDTVAANFIGGDGSLMTHLQLASKNGLGIGDLSKIKIVGADLSAIKMQFQH